MIAAKVNVDSPDFGPMVQPLARAGVTSPPEVVLADAGYWRQMQME